MYRTILFYVGKKNIILNEQSFTLGQLTAEILNISPRKFQRMRVVCFHAEDEINRYIQTKDADHWCKANLFLLLLDRQLREYQLFRLIKDQRCVLSETESFLNRLLQQTLEGFDAVPPDELEQTWNDYLDTFNIYNNILGNIASFGNMIQNFVRHYLSRLKKLTPENYAAALYDYLEDATAAQIIVDTPAQDYFSSVDPVMLRFVPRETVPGSDEYQIYEYYEVNNLQTLLKMDFYRALCAGHVIRQCECCRRYFLLTKGYHTKYCDSPNPDNPKYTCAQLGYRQTGMKEAAKDDPKKQALLRCYQRLNKDVSRGNLTSGQRDMLYAKAEDLHHEARMNPEITFEAFDRSLATDHLCHLCNITRTLKKAGRPRKNS